MYVYVLVAQSCLTLYHPMDCSPSDSSVHGVLQARIVEWQVIPSPGDLPNPGIKPRSPALQADSLPCESPGKPKYMYVLSCFSRVQLCMTLWTAACQAPLTMVFSKARILEWVAIPSPQGSSWPRDGNHGISCPFCIAGRFFTTEPPGKPKYLYRFA